MCTFVLYVRVKQCDEINTVEFLQCKNNTSLKIEDIWPRAATTPPFSEPIWEAAFSSNVHEEQKRSMTSDQGPPGATACWDWSQNALGRESYGKKSFFVFHHSEGWWAAAARVKRGFSGKEDGEDFSAFFGVLSGEAQCECVFMWENINELLPTGRGALPIISSWENTRRNRREMKEDHVLPFCFHWFITERGFVSQQFVRKQQRVLLLWWMEMMCGHTLTPPPTEVSLSNTMNPTSTKLLTSELPV